MRVVTEAWRRVRGWLTAIPAPVILAAGWLALVLYAYPGVMTMDSFDQLREARTWFFTDSHPPAMAALWGIVDRIHSGPFGMLVLQLTGFELGLYFVLRRALGPRPAAAWTCALLLFPPVGVPLAVIWKDNLMAACLLLGTAGILAGGRRARLLGLVAFSAATALRYNAPAATLPLIVLLFEWRPGRRWLVRYAIALGAWIAVTAAGFAVNTALTDRQMHFWYSSVALGDIVGTLANVDGDIPDGELKQILAPTGILVDHDLHRAIRAKYKPEDFQQLITGENHLWDMPISGTDPAPEPQREAIGRAWSELVLGHPGAYARYRLAVFGEVLGIPKKFAGAIVVTHAAQYPGMLEYMGLAKGWYGFQESAEGAMKWLAKHTRLFRPHVYALLALLLLALYWRERDVLALVLSGLGLELSLLPLVQTPDYRYSHWLVVTTCAAIVMGVARRAGSTRTRA